MQNMYVFNAILVMEFSSNKPSISCNRVSRLSTVRHRSLSVLWMIDYSVLLKEGFSFNVHSQRHAKRVESIQENSAKKSPALVYNITSIGLIDALFS